jgi:hypothetical protein
VWKRNEREVAHDFGTERTPLSGGASRITRSDTLHRVLFIDVKRRKSHSILRTFRDISVLARRERKIPVLALAEERAHGYWMVVHCDDVLAFAEEVVKGFRK